MQMKDMVYEYKELLILVYFKNYSGSYSIVDLKNKLGMSFFNIVKQIQKMIDEGLLCIADNNLVSLTLKGRIYLGKSKVENFKFLDNSIQEKEKNNVSEGTRFKLNKYFFKAKWINKF